MLGDRVRRAPGEATDTGERTDVHDAASTMSEHHPTGSPRDAEGAYEIHVQDMQELLVGDVLAGPGSGYSGGVHHAVESVVTGDDRLDQLRYGG